MAKSGESHGHRVRGVMKTEWNGERLKFVTISEWEIVDARGQRVELIGRTPTHLLEDDEWLERSLTRRARALFAEARAHAEERQAGVQRLELGDVID